MDPLPLAYYYLLFEWDDHYFHLPNVGIGTVKSMIFPSSCLRTRTEYKPNILAPGSAALSW